MFDHARSLLLSCIWSAVEHTYMVGVSMEEVMAMVWIEKWAGLPTVGK